MSRADVTHVNANIPVAAGTFEKAKSELEHEVAESRMKKKEEENTYIKIAVPLNALCSHMGVLLWQNKHSFK